MYTARSEMEYLLEVSEEKPRKREDQEKVERDHCLLQDAANIQHIKRAYHVSKIYRHAMQAMLIFPVQKGADGGWKI